MPPVLGLHHRREALPLVLRKHRGLIQPVGDLGLETQVILWRKQSQVAVSTGVELTLPTGSRERRLGGDVVVAPFLSAGLG